MEELIPIHINKNGPVVSARDIHTYLESKQDFSHWIKARLERYGFVEGQDYTSFVKTIERETGATKRIEYALTMDTGKEVCMIENNDKGREIRRYFIQAERERNLLVLDPSSMNRIELLKLAIKNEEKRLELQAKINADKPKVDYANVVENSSGTIKLGDFAKVIQKEHGVEDIGQNRLFAFLRSKKILMGSNLAYQEYYNAKYFEHSKTDINHPDYSFEVTSPRLTGKGQIWLLKRVREEYPQWRELNKKKK